MTTSNQTELQFTQRREGLWIAPVEGESSYRIEFDTELSEFKVEFISRRRLEKHLVFGTDRRRIRYFRVSSHKKFERAEASARKHHRDRSSKVALAS